MRPAKYADSVTDDLENRALAACSRGDAGGLQELYGRYSRRVFRTCLRILGEQAAAEDLTQDIFLHVFRKIALFKGRSRFSTWLYLVSVNMALSAIARERTRTARQTDVPIQELTAADGAGGPEQAVAAGEWQA